jgi:hypothetical protein
VDSGSKDIFCGKIREYSFDGPKKLFPDNLIITGVIGVVGRQIARKINQRIFTPYIRGDDVGCFDKTRKRETGIGQIGHVKWTQ